MLQEVLAPALTDLGRSFTIREEGMRAVQIVTSLLTASLGDAHVWNVGDKGEDGADPVGTLLDSDDRGS